MATSMQAVLPEAVGSEIASGHWPAMTSAARRTCQGKGSTPFNSWKKAGKSRAVRALMPPPPEAA